MVFQIANSYCQFNRFDQQGAAAYWRPADGSPVCRALTLAKILYESKKYEGNLPKRMESNLPLHRFSCLSLHWDVPRWYRYLDCGILQNGFARVRCGDCGHEYLLAFSCKRRHFCPSCHQKRVVEFGDWLCREVVKAVPHRHVVFSIPKILRRYFLFDRKLLSELSRCVWAALKAVQVLSPGWKSWSSNWYPGRVKQALKRAGADKEYIDGYLSEAISGDYDHLLAFTMGLSDSLGTNTIRNEPRFVFGRREALLVGGLGKFFLVSIISDYGLPSSEWTYGKSILQIDNRRPLGLISPNLQLG
jgi:hypothetical protein